MSKTVIISDTHLGMDGADGSGYYSLLSLGANATDDIKKAIAEKTDAFVKLMNDFSNGENIILIGCGDILDLAMSHMRPALEDLVALLKKLPMVSEFIYVAGNHDHHIWTMYEERKRLCLPMIYGNLPDSGSIFEPTAPGGEPLDIVSELLYRQLGRIFPVKIAYPILKIDSPEGPAVLMHGHLFGDIYTLVSDVLTPYITDTNRVRAQAIVNASTTEFVDWLIGEMGDGMGVEGGLAGKIFSDMQKGSGSSVNELLSRAVDVLLPNGIVKGIPDSWERWFAKKIAKHFVDGTLPHINKITSADRHQDINITRASTAKWLNDVLVDKDVRVFITGHTHIGDDFEADVGGRKVRCLNPGGWQVEPLYLTADTRAILIDKDIKIVSI